MGAHSSGVTCCLADRLKEGEPESAGWQTSIVRADRLLDKRMDGRTDGQTDERMDGWMEGGMDEVKSRPHTSPRRTLTASRSASSWRPPYILPLANPPARPPARPLVRPAARPPTRSPPAVHRRFTRSPEDQRLPASCQLAYIFFCRRYVRPSICRHSSHHGTHGQPCESPTLRSPPATAD